MNREVSYTVYQGCVNISIHGDCCWNGTRCEWVAERECKLKQEYLKAMEDGKTVKVVGFELDRPTCCFVNCMLPKPNEDKILAIGYCWLEEIK